ncbi:hypothetical protein KUCAC02_025079, partial [Chaenocephalus aceratus]
IQHRGGGLAFAVNRVDILLTAVESGEDTGDPGGFQRNEEQRWRGQWTGDIYPAQDITYTCSALESFRKETQMGPT